jgi:hypothetical protein
MILSSNLLARVASSLKVMSVKGLESCVAHNLVDLSNYWTAVVYFKARNGTYKRVPQKAQDTQTVNSGMVSPSF